MKMENTLCLEKWKFSLTLLLYEAIREKLFCRVIFQFLAFFFERLVHCGKLTDSIIQGLAIQMVKGIVV